MVGNVGRFDLGYLRHMCGNWHCHAPIRDTCRQDGPYHERYRGEHGLKVAKHPVTYLVKLGDLCVFLHCFYDQSLIRSQSPPSPPPPLFQHVPLSSFAHVPQPQKYIEEKETMTKTKTKMTVITITVATTSSTNVEIKSFHLLLIIFSKN